VLAFYADESGSFSLRAADQPWVVLLAIGFDDDSWTVIDEAMNDLKRAYFRGRTPREVEIRSHDLRMAHVRPRSDNVFSTLPRDLLRRFGDDLYAVIDALPFAWCASVLHKPSVVSSLSVRRGEALFTVAYLRLLQSLDGWCRAVGKPGRIFLDQRDARLHGGVHEAIIRAHDERRDNSRPGLARVVERPYFHESARSNHLQLADILAYNVLRRHRSGDTEYTYFRRIVAKEFRL
jgi:Protein of unknown function (DUF3800)